MELGYYPGCALHGSSNDYERFGAGLPGRAGRRAPRTGRLDLLRRDGRPFAQSQAGGGPAGPQPGHRRARRVRRAAGPLPDVLDGTDEGRAAPWRADADAAPARCPRSSNSTFDGRHAGAEPDSGLPEGRPGADQGSSEVGRSTDFKPACYYGCLLTRPPETLRFDDCEQPSLDGSRPRGAGRASRSSGTTRPSAAAPA